MRRPPNLMKAMTVTEPVRAPVAPARPSDYLDLYGLSKPPFGGQSDTSGYILFGSHRRAFELLIDHMMNGHGVIVLAGEGGVGKTETLRSAAAVAAEVRTADDHDVTATRRSYHNRAAYDVAGRRPRTLSPTAPQSVIS